jgi:hypothetical protein
MGIPLVGTAKELGRLKTVIGKFKKNDYRVTLGSTLEPETRKYYTTNNFSLLLSHIDRGGEDQPEA